MNYCKRKITCGSWIWKTLAFQFHCISHQGAMFGFHGQRIFRNCSAYVRRLTSSHKIAESTSVCTEEDKYTDSNIFGRYAYNGSNNGRSSHIQRHCIFLLQHLGFVLNLEKSLLNPVREIVFLGVTINSLKMSLSLPQEKVLKIQSQCQGVLASNDCLRNNKIVRPSCLNILGSFASPDESFISSNSK